jgi:hypothetical protein
MQKFENCGDSVDGGYSFLLFIDIENTIIYYKVLKKEKQT